MERQPAIQSGGRGGGSPPQDQKEKIIKTPEQRKACGGSQEMNRRKVTVPWKIRYFAVLLAVIWLGCLLVAIPASASAPTAAFLQNPQHTYVNTGGSPVTWNVSETVWNAASGSNTLLKSNYIVQNSLGPIASFTQNITQGYSPLVVQFSDTSSYGTSNFWNFGDGTNATSTQFPVHTYTSTGQYTVTLTETNSYGSSTATGKVLVNVIATPTPTPTPTPQTNNLSVWKRIA